MTTESVKYLIDAEDRATAKIRAVTEDVEKQVKQVREVGGKAKASTELVGTLAGALGGTGLGVFAGELAQVTERVSAFSEVAKTGKAGALAFKAGIGAAVGILGFKFGKAIGDVIFQTEKFRKELQLTNEEANRLSSEGIANLIRRFSRAKEDIGVLIDPGEQEKAQLELLARTKTNLDAVGQQVTRYKAKIREAENATFKSENFKALIEIDKQLLSDAQARLDTLKAQKAELVEITGERRKALDLARDNKSRVESSKAYLDSLREEVSLLKMTATERRNAEAAKNTTGLDGVEARALLAERDAINANAKREQEAAQKRQRQINETNQARKRADAEALSAQKRIQQIQSSTLQSFQLQTVELVHGKEAAQTMAFQFQGIDKEQAGLFANIKSRLEKVNSLGKPTAKTSALRGTDNRFGTGRAERQAELRDKRQAKAENRQRDKYLRELVDLTKQAVKKESTATIKVRGR